jgi:hypothetical protein
VRNVHFHGHSASGNLSYSCANTGPLGSPVAVASTRWLRGNQRRPGPVGARGPRAKARNTSQPFESGDFSAIHSHPVVFGPHLLQAVSHSRELGSGHDSTPSAGPIQHQGLSTGDRWPGPAWTLSVIRAETSSEKARSLKSNPKGAAFTVHS